MDAEAKKTALRMIPANERFEADQLLRLGADQRLEDEVELLCGDRTAKVDLDDESVVGVQGMLGVAVTVWAVRLGAEYNLARVPGYAFKVAFGT